MTLRDETVNLERHPSGRLTPAGKLPSRRRLEIHAYTHGIGTAEVLVHADNADQRRAEELEVAQDCGPSALPEMAERMLAPLRTAVPSALTAPYRH